MWNEKQNRDVAWFHLTNRWQYLDELGVLHVDGGKGAFMEWMEWLWFEIANDCRISGQGTAGCWFAHWIGKNTVPHWSHCLEADMKPSIAMYYPQKWASDGTDGQFQVSGIGTSVPRGLPLEMVPDREGLRAIVGPNWRHSVCVCVCCLNRIFLEMDL